MQRGNSPIDVFEEDLPWRRPAFLNILCVFSFVGCGMYFLSGIYELYNTYSIKPESPWIPLNEEITRLYRYAFPLAVIHVIANLVSLAGVFMMFKLKRPGFWIYTSGQLAFPVAQAVLIGFQNMVSFEYLFLYQIMGAIVPLVFIGLYAANYKALR
jgi:hypothetical protein